MSPLMFFSTRRSLVSFTQDLYRVPDKVQAAMDAMVDELTNMPSKLHASPASQELSLSWKGRLFLLSA